MSARTNSDPSLPGMLGDGPPEHGIRSRSLMLAIVGCGVVCFLALAKEPGGSTSERVLLGLIGAMILGGCVFVARGVQRFRCWAWFFVMGWLLLMIAPALVLLSAEVEWRQALSYAPAVVVLGWIHWLWLRRGDFLPDPRIDALRRRDRWVTPGWRAARLSRLGAAVPAARPAPPVAGALWARRWARES